MRVLIAAVSGFAGGVFVRSLFFESWWPVIFILLIAVIIYFVPKLLSVYSLAPLENESSNSLTGLAAVFFIFVALGMGRAAIADTPLPASFASDVRHRVSYEGVVISDPDVRDTNQRMEIRVTKNGEQTNVLAVTSRNASVEVGDSVNVSGTLLVPENFADDNGRIFQYDKYLERDGVRFILNYAYIRVESHAPWYSISAALARAKHAFIDGIAATLPEPHASLAGGITIGGKSGLGNELKEAFTRSSLVHIIVLSGYNVMVVAEWVMTLLTLTPLKRRWAITAGALALIIFVGIAGATATAIRAAVMALIALYARATGRSYAAGRALLFVILLMLIWNPLYLAFDPGFGLSVVATAGLIWLAPIIEVYLSFIKNKFWNNVVATTLAAQVAVLPLLLYNTGNLSIVAIPTNLLVVPLVPLAMGFSALAGFAGAIFSSFAPLIGIILAFPAYIANEYLIFIARESSALPLAAFTLPPFPFWLALLAYAGLIYFVALKRSSTTFQLRFAKKASI
ncbi:MAG: ComEC/Rec2 family competence protein [bacterium]|nr:ComEC/Rec2 family competence protein [bacterium]